MSQNRKWFSLVSLLIVAAVLIAACAPAATPTTPPPQPTQPPPQPTQPPPPTAAPTEVPKPEGHPLSYEAVRQAIAMGIDRQAIVDKFYPPGSSVASHFTPCAIPGGCEGEEWYAYDPAKAREILAAAGFGDGFDLTIAYCDVG